MQSKMKRRLVLVGPEINLSVSRVLSPKIEICLAKVIAIFEELKAVDYINKRAIILSDLLSSLYSFSYIFIVFFGNNFRSRKLLAVVGNIIVSEILFILFSGLQKRQNYPESTLLRICKRALIIVAFILISTALVFFHLPLVL